MLGAAGALWWQSVHAQATPPPCDDVVLTLHRQLADQVQHQLLGELAAARRELAARPPAPTPPVPAPPVKPPAARSP